jgi:hypothetical protein
VQAVAGAVAYVGTPPWLPGAVALPLQPADGAFNTATEALAGTLDTTALAPGRHLVFVQASDATGQAGPVSAAFVDIAAPQLTAEAVPTARGGRRITLQWSGLLSPTVEFVRNGVRLPVLPNTGRHTQSVPPGTWTYRVCAAGSAVNCSAERVVSF